MNKNFFAGLVIILASCTEKENPISVDMSMSCIEISSIYSDEIIDDGQDISLSDTTYLLHKQVCSAEKSAICTFTGREMLNKVDMYAVNYAYTIYIKIANLVIPIGITRNVESEAKISVYDLSKPIVKDISMRLIGIEPQVTYTESHCRSYHDLSFDIYLDGNKYEVKRRVSIYTANTPIAFGAEVSDWVE